jgi:uncharacterized membrane protein YdjX (TVP38/TMEM64 family)
MAVPDSVPFFPYISASTLGSIPEVLLNVIFGQNIRGIADMLRGEKLPPTQLAISLVGKALAFCLH